MDPRNRFLLSGVVAATVTATAWRPVDRTAATPGAPLEFLSGETPEKLGLTGRESFEIVGLAAAKPQGEIEVVARDDAGRQTSFRARIRIDTPQEMEYYRHGGILQYVVRNLAQQKKAA